MSAHKQVTTCLRGGGPLSKFCGCYHCTLACCSVCGGYEGSLTTDCPGGPVAMRKQREVYESDLDYTDERGWHQSGVGMSQRSPRFAPTEASNA